MANVYVVALGITLLLIATFGYFYPVNNSVYTAIQLDEFCSAGYSQLALFFGNQDIVQGCQRMKMLSFGIYGVGVIGVILIIVGAVVSEGRKTSDTNSLEILKERYAKGEITNEEYRRMKKELGDDGCNPHPHDGVTYNKD